MHIANTFFLNFKLSQTSNTGWFYQLLPVPIYQKSIKLHILIHLKIHWTNFIHFLFFSFCSIIRLATDFWYLEWISSKINLCSTYDTILEYVHMRGEMNSNWYEISYRLKISLMCSATSLLVFTWIEARWNSKRYSFHIGQFDRNEMSNWHEIFMWT